MSDKLEFAFSHRFYPCAIPSRQCLDSEDWQLSKEALTDDGGVTSFEWLRSATVGWVRRRPHPEGDLDLPAYVRVAVVTG